MLAFSVFSDGPARGVLVSLNLQSAYILPLLVRLCVLQAPCYPQGPLPVSPVTPSCPFSPSLLSLCTFWPLPGCISCGAAFSWPVAALQGERSFQTVRRCGRCLPPAQPSETVT